MKAMILKQITDLSNNATPLELAELPDPVPGEKDVLLKVRTCGVCHTELDEIEGRTPPPNFPAVLGHEVVGNVIETGSRVKKTRRRRPGGHRLDPFRLRNLQLVS